jgi:ABC-type enterochelin transport system permease subunit
METDRLYKLLFYIGSGWNFAISTTLFILAGSLPSIIGIEPPRYPIFIHFNLMSVFFFGCIQWTIARDIRGHRSFVKVLVWAKLGMGAVFLYSILLAAPVRELIVFLAPGVVLDVIFGLIFWRFLIFSRTKVAV